MRARSPAAVERTVVAQRVQAKNIAARAARADIAAANRPPLVKAKHALPNPNGIDPEEELDGRLDAIEFAPEPPEEEPEVDEE